MLASGDQIEVAFADQRVTVAAVGATLREYEVNGCPVLDGFDANQVCPDGRGQVLMPWPNRVADGRYEFSGSVHELPIDEPDLGHAIHGLVRWAEWRVEHRGDGVVRLGHGLRARPGYPFELDVAVEYRLSASGLTVTFEATNVGSAPCPFGAGAHPYFTFPGTPVDAIELALQARDWLDVDARSIPQSHRPVAGSAVDFRRSHVIGETRLDHAFSSLERDDDGVANVFLRHGRDEIRLWLDRAFEFVQVYTGDTLPDPTRRRHSVAVEPMTCAPNAFNSGDGIRVLASGQGFENRWGITVS